MLHSCQSFVVWHPPNFDQVKIVTMTDAEKHQSIRDLRSKYSENSKLLKQVFSSQLLSNQGAANLFNSHPSPFVQLESQHRSMLLELRRAAVTASHIDKLPESTPTYESIGKAYFMQPRESILERLEGIVARSNSAIKTTAAQKDAIGNEQDSLKKEISEQVTALRND